MKMSINTSTINRKPQILQSTLSCLFTSVVIFYLIYFKTLYKIGKYSSLSLIASFVFLEYLKAFLRSGAQNDKNTKSKKYGWKSKLKCGAIIVSMIAIYYIMAVCFGAAFTSKQEETFMFSILLTILTAVPLCLQLGADATIFVFMELTTQDNINEDFKHNVCLTLFGAWLGAIVIPLDWDRPWQVWPIPCCLGALVGYTLSHAFILLKCMPTFEKVLNKKPGKYNL